MQSRETTLSDLKRCAVRIYSCMKVSADSSLLVTCCSQP